MNKTVRYAFATFLFASLVVTDHHRVSAQQKPETAAKPAPVTQKPTGATSERVSIPVRVQIVLSRYKGDKKITSLPFSLSLATDQNGGLNVGARIPYVTFPAPGASGPGAGDKPAQPVASHSFNQVGTGVNCIVRQVDQGRFRVDVTVTDTSVATPDDASSRAQGIPAFRTFSLAGNSVVLRDGETAQLTTAADPVSGELMRVDITLSLVK